MFLELSPCDLALDLHVYTRSCGDICIHCIARPETAGVGGSMPSLATILSTTTAFHNLNHVPKRSNRATESVNSHG